MNACHHERKPKMQCGGRRKRSESPPETKPSAGKAVRGSDIKLDRTYSALEAKSNILSPPPTPQISDGRPSVNQIWGLDGQQQGAPRGAHWKSNQRITEIKTCKSTDTAILGLTCFFSDVNHGDSSVRGHKSRNIQKPRCTQPGSLGDLGSEKVLSRHLHQTRSS